MRLERRRPRLQRRGFRGVKPRGSEIANRFFVLRTHAGGDACVPVASALPKQIKILARFEVRREER